MRVTTAQLAPAAYPSAAVATGTQLPDGRFAVRLLQPMPVHVSKV